MLFTNSGFPLDRQSINITTKYILERLRKRVIWVRPNIAINWILHHDNAPAHAAFSVAQFLTSKDIRVMPQPPYSPDLAPCDFFLFQKAKSAMKGHHFESTERHPEFCNAGLKRHSSRCVPGMLHSGSTAGKRVCRHKGCTLKVAVF